MAVEDGEDFDPLTVPAVMQKTVRRIDEGGFPVTALLDYEQALQQWMKSNTANTNTRLTLVKDELGGINASVETLADAQATLEGAFATYKVTVTANFAAVNASVTNEATARANGDSALATNISTLSTTVGSHTASISTLSASVNGLGVEWSIQGNINGVTGGLSFTGIQRANGTGATYNLEINSNVTINGNLLVNGTILNGAAANRAFTQGAGSTSGGMSASVGITTRGAAQVLVIANFNGASNLYFGLGTAPGIFEIQRNGGTLQSVGNNYEASGSGGSAGIAFQQTCLLAVDTPPAGFNTYSCGTNNGGGVGGVTIAVVELSK